MSIAIGLSAKSPAAESIAIGSDAVVKVKDAERAVIIGESTTASVATGVALGASSDAVTASDIVGYSPKTGIASTLDDDVAWKSGYGAVSIAAYDNGNVAKTRQIVGLSAGTEDTDAVNVAQLKELREMVVEGWKFTIGGENSTSVSLDTENTIDFSSGSKNFKIAKGEKDNKVTFDLAKELELNSIKINDDIKLGASSLSAAGLIVADGPEMTKDGISAGSKKITNVATGTADTDAVNVAQLKAVQEAVAIKGLKINTAGKDFADAVAAAENSIAIGSKANVDALSTGAIAFGHGASVKNLTEKRGSDGAIALGENATVSVDNGIALGSKSIADVAAGVGGYDPSIRENADRQDNTWIGGLGALSIGDAKKGKTRQIVGVAAGTQDTDAVNVAQLKALQDSITPSWDLSVNGKNKTNVNSTNPMDLAAGSTNITLTKGEKDNNVKFDLAKDLTLESVKTGNTTLDATGLVITGGPKITTSGIDAGSKKITGVAEGSNNTDAVNFSQLNKVKKEVEQQVAANSFVKQDAKTQHITIGKDTGGDRINIANNKGETRTLTGVKDGNISKDSTDAVNGSQLFATNTNVTKNAKDITQAQGDIAKNSLDITEAKNNISTLDDNISKYLGGGANVLKGTEPTYTVQKGTYHNVADAFAGVDSSFTNVNNKITKVENAVTNIHNEIAQKIDQNALSWNEKEQAFVATHGEEDSKTNSKITSLQNGAVSKDSTDAINGSQLFDTNEKVAAYFGGDASYKDGSWTAPTFKFKTIKDDGTEEDGTYYNVAAAFAGVGTSITNVKKEITNLNNEITKVESESIVKWDETTKSINIGKEKDGTIINLQNKDNENRTIAGVIGGKISKDSNEAVNGSQLFDTNEKVAAYFGGDASYKDGSWTAPKFVVKKFNSQNSVTDATYGNVTAAFAGVGESFEKVKDSFKEIKDEITKKIQKEITTVQGDALLWDKAKSAFVATHGEKEGKKSNSKITFLQNGDISEGSTDAVTGSQLYSLNNDIAHYFDKNAGYNGDGTWKAPTFKLKAVKDDGNSEEKTYDTVAEAFEDVGTSITNVQNKVTEQVNNAIENINTQITNVTENNLVQHDSKTGKITIGAKENGNLIDVTNNKGETRTITGVKGGTLSASSNEAVTGSQLFATNSNVTKNTNDINKATDKITKNSTDITVLNSEVSNIQGDALLWSKDAGAFVATHGEKGSKKTNSRITSLLGGEISANSTDAVTGSQLYFLGSEVTKSLGGNAKYENGTWTAPKFTVKTFQADGGVIDSTYDNVAAAFSGVGTSFANVNNNITNKFNELTQNITNITQEVQGDALLWGKDENAFVAQHGAKGSKKTNSKITSLKDGVISSLSTDAVNGSQLYSLNKQFAAYFGGGAGYNAKGEWTAPTFKVKGVKENGQTEDQDYTDVAAAFAGVGTSFKNVAKKINKEISDAKSDSLNWNKTANAFVATHGEKEGDAKSNSKITSLQNGAINENSTDAVAGQQLHQLGTQVAKFLGGNAAFKDGAFTEPTYNLSQISKEGEIKDAEFKDVGKAFTGLDESIKNVNNRIKEVSQGVAQDSLNWSAKDKAFVAQHGEGDAKSNSKITSLQNGTINEESTDAVAGQQLHQLGTGIATYLGGGAKYENGAWTAPKFTVKTVKADGSDVEDKDYSSVSAAFAGVGTSFTNIHKELKKEISQVVSDSLVKWDETTKSINIGKEKDGTAINIANKDKGDRILSGVKAGQNDNEAVNKGQLDKSLEKLSNSLQSDESAVVHYDKKDDDNSSINYASVTLGKGKGSAPVGLHNVADGQIAKDSHDAITGGQINTIGSDVAKFLGGNAAFKDGAFTEPTYNLSQISKEGEIKDAEFKDVGKAFTGLDESIKNVNDRIKEVSQGVAQDSLNWSAKDKAFVAQHGEGDAKSNSKITSLQNGAINENSTDAVAGQQLHQLGTQVAKSLGGNAAFKDGAFTEPTYNLSQISKEGEIKDAEFKDVGKAFTGLDESIKNVNDRIKEVSQGVAQDSLNWSAKDKAFVAQHGEGDAKSNSKITSLQNGTINENSTDAVAGQQLHQLGTGIATYLGGGAKYEGGEWTAPSFKVKTFSSDGNTKDENYTSVSAAFEGVGTSFANVNNNITNKFNELTENITNITQEVQGDALLWDKAKSAFVATHGEKEGDAKSNSKITSLQNGAINENSTDAVAGQQLHQLGTGIATYLGGGAKYENGAWTAPKFTVKTFKADGSDVEDKDYSSVSAAFAGVGTSFTNIHKELKKEISQVVSDSLVKWDETTKSINIGKEKDGTAINIANKDKGDRTLSGVKAATQNNQAVNKEQFDKGLKDLSLSLQSDESAVVHYDKKDDDNSSINYASVTLGKGKGSAPVGLHNVADGQIAKDSHDAITGGQINTIGSDVAKFLGGNAAFKDGAFTEPTYNLSQISKEGEIKDAEFKDVGKAFTGLDESIKNVNDRIKEVSQGVAQDSLNWSAKDKAFVAQHGEGDAKSNSKITSLQNGAINENSTDAVAGQQLHQLGTQVAKSLGGNAAFKDGAFTEPTYNLSQISKEGEIKDAEFKDVGKAFTGLDESIKNVNDRIKEVSQGVAQDSLNWSAKDKAFVAQHGEGDAKSNSKITSLQNGAINENSTDAVAGQQLHQLGTQVAKSLGGNAAFKDGAFTEPTYNLSQISKEGEIKDAEFKDVGKAFTGLDESIKNVNDRIKEVSQGVAQDSLNWSAKDKAFVAQHGEGDAKSTARLPLFRMEQLMRIPRML
ncbi:hypothetical protein [Bartonella harrusi]